MASFNRVVILGNLGQDPELRYTTNQTAVCTLNIATTDYRTGADGQRVEQTEWHRVVVFSKQAENCQKYLAKGRSVLVEGRLQTRSWEDQKTGQKRYMTEIVAQAVQFVGGGGAGRDRGVGQPAQPGQQMSGGSSGSSGSSGNYGYGGGAAGGGGASGYGASSLGNYSPSSTGPGSAPREREAPRRFEGDPLESGDAGDFGGVPPPGLEEIPF